MWKNRLLLWRHRFFKKKKRNQTGWGEDDFTFNIVLPHDDLTHFKKKNQQTLFYKLMVKTTQKYKKALHSRMHVH